MWEYPSLWLLDLWQLSHSVNMSPVVSFILGVLLYKQTEPKDSPMCRNRDPTQTNPMAFLEVFFLTMVYLRLFYWFIFFYVLPLQIFCFYILVSDFDFTGFSVSNVCYEVSECVFYSFYLTHFFLFVLFSPYSFLFYLILLFEIPICVIVIEFFFF